MSSKKRKRFEENYRKKVLDKKMKMKAIRLISKLNKEFKNVIGA